MLTAPESVDEDKWFDVLSRLIWAELIPEGQHEPIGILAPIAGNDPTLSKYCGEATTWTTATPVVLPGHDSRRGRSRPERIVGRLLRHAHIPEAMVDGVAMEPAARLRGSDMPTRYRRPEHLSMYPCRHMSIRWRRPVTGPVVLGAGIGYGLGQFIPVGDGDGDGDAGFARVAFDGGGAGRHGGRLLQRMRGRHSIAIAATGINSRHRPLRPVDGIPGSVTYENRRNRDEFLPDRSSRLRVRNRGTGEKCGSTKSLGDTVTDGRASYAASSSRRARARS